MVEIFFEAWILKTENMRKANEKYVKLEKKTDGSLYRSDQNNKRFIHEYVYNMYFKHNDMILS